MTIGKLRAVNDADMLKILDWRNSKLVRDNSYSADEITLPIHLDWWTQMMVDPTQKVFIFEDEGTALGVVLFSNISELDKRATWAFYASPDAPKGTGRKMEYNALDKAFIDLKLQKLCCEVLDFNKAVINLHKSFGFEVEGVLKQHRFVRDGLRDVIQMAMFKDAWLASRFSKLQLNTKK